MPQPAPGKRGKPNHLWAVVYYTPSQASVQSRLTGPVTDGGPGSPATAYVWAPDAQTAVAAAQQKAGHRWYSLDRVYGPYANQKAAVKGDTTRIRQALDREHPGALPNPLSGIEAVGAFFVKLMDPRILIRIGEVVLGMILMAVGLAQLTGAQNIVSAAVKTRL